jgi:hypothetical protein
MMLSRAPIENVIHQGIKRDIALMLEHRRFRGAVLLTYAGIDTMAFIDMPDSQLEVKKSDFVSWADRYMKFDRPVTGLELYGARCGLLHSYGIESRISAGGAGREIGYFSGADAGPDVRADPTISPSFVMISVEGLVAAFFRGIDRFLIEVFGDALRRPVAEERLRRCIHTLDQGFRISQ